MLRSAALSLLLAAAALHAQDEKPVMQTRPEAPPASSIKVNANLVVLPTVVRDKKGALVNNLSVADFTLKASAGRSLDNAKPQTIKYFDHDTDVPLTLGLLVDVSRSQRDVLPDEKSASQSFLSKSLLPAAPASAAAANSPARPARAADKAFIVQFAKQIELLQDVTEDVHKLQRAVDLLGTESPSFHTTDAGDTRDSEGRMEHHGGTSLYDALFLSADEVTSKQKGRKALIVLTDGVDVGSKEALTDAIESAQRADTIVYAIYFKGKEQRQQNNGFPGGNRRGGMGYPGGGGGYPGGGYPGGGYPGGGYPGGGYPGGGGGGYPGGGGGGNNPNGGGRGGNAPTRKPSVDGKQVLDRICGETGGAVYEVTKKDTVDSILTRIGDELRSEYLLGFTPTEDAAREGYHQIDLELTGEAAKKKLDVQVRAGYYASSAN